MERQRKISTIRWLGNCMKLGGKWSIGQSGPRHMHIDNMHLSESPSRNASILILHPPPTLYLILLNIW